MQVIIAFKHWKDLIRSKDLLQYQQLDQTYQQSIPLIQQLRLTIDQQQHQQILSSNELLEQQHLIAHHEQLLFSIVFQLHYLQRLQKKVFNHWCRFLHLNTQWKQFEQQQVNKKLCKVFNHWRSFYHKQHLQSQIQSHLQLTNQLLTKQYHVIQQLQLYWHC